MLKEVNYRNYDIFCFFGNILIFKVFYVKVIVEISFELINDMKVIW